MFTHSLTDFFTNSVLRGPTIASMLMCAGASMIGVLVFLRGQSLVGEALSHASYPGALLGLSSAGALFLRPEETTLALTVAMCGAGLTALLGMRAIHLLEERYGVRSDSALCAILSIFFGAGILIASWMQFRHTALYRQGQSYLLGQVATLLDQHIVLYGVLALVIALCLYLLLKELRVATFDPLFASSIGLSRFWVELLTQLLIVSAIVLGMRSVGVVLVSSMLIAPAAAARQWTDSMTRMYFLSALFGLGSGFFGVWLAEELPPFLSKNSAHFTLATGPTIVLVASLLCFFSLLFAPKRGYFPRYLRAIQFRLQSLRENLLKTFWRHGPNTPLTYEKIKEFHPNGWPFPLRWTLRTLVGEGLLRLAPSGHYRLSSAGRKRASWIVRLHRLWELYLADHLGLGVERVHKRAEEMEHILTPELEKELTETLQNPSRDPHHQPIPPREGSS